MAKIAFSEAAWQDYLYWQTQDKKTLKKVNVLLAQELYFS
jgi:toxin YoeB